LVAKGLEILAIKQCPLRDRNNSSTIFINLRQLVAEGLVSDYRIFPPLSLGYFKC